MLRVVEVKKYNVIPGEVVYLWDYHKQPYMVISVNEEYITVIPLDQYIRGDTITESERIKFTWYHFYLWYKVVPINWDESLEIICNTKYYKEGAYDSEGYKM